MKVLLVNHFPLEGSGSGTYTKNIADHLARRGHEVHVVFPENMPPAQIPGVGLHPVYFAGDKPVSGSLPFNFPCFTTHPRSLTTFADLTPEETGQYLEAFDKAISEVVERFHPDILHAQHIWYLADLAAKQSCPCVVTTHGTDLMGYRKWPELRGAADSAAAGCDRIIAISKDNYTDAAQVFPNETGKMTLLLNGYNEITFYPTEVDRGKVFSEFGISYQGEKVVLFAGKLTDFKGVDTLLYAAHRYEAALHEHVVTLIAGSGEQDGALRRLARELNLQSVHFLGHRSPDELRLLYNSADVLAMPSRREPFGLVALEAMACGTPVVATNEGGLPEFIHPEVGALVDVDDYEGLSNALLHELRRSQDEPGRRATVAGYAHENYTQSKFIDRLETIYMDVLTHQGHEEERRV